MNDVWSGSGCCMYAFHETNKSLGNQAKRTAKSNCSTGEILAGPFFFTAMTTSYGHFSSCNPLSAVFGRPLTWALQLTAKQTNIQQQAISSKHSLWDPIVRVNAGGCFLYLEGMSTFWGGPLWGTTSEGPPTPNPPFQCPHPDKTGTNLLLVRFCIHLHTHQDLKLSFCIIMGQQLRYGRSCTHDLPGTHNWIAQPHIASISLEFQWLSPAGSILEVWSEVLHHWLGSPRGLHTSACAPEFRTCPQTPLLSRQSTELEPMLYFNFRGSGPGKNWKPPPPTKIPPGDQPHLPSSPILPKCIPIDSSRRQKSAYMNFYWKVDSHSKVKLYEASW